MSQQLLAIIIAVGCFAGFHSVTARSLQATEQDLQPTLPAGVTAVLETTGIDPAATQALPQEYVAGGWARHTSGHCSYKGYRAWDCPQLSGAPKFWQLLLHSPGGKFQPVVPPSRPQLQCTTGLEGQTCTDSSQCCSALGLTCIQFESIAATTSRCAAACPASSEPCTAANECCFGLLCASGFCNPLIG